MANDTASRLNTTGYKIKRMADHVGFCLDVDVSGLCTRAWHALAPVCRYAPPSYGKYTDLTDYCGNIQCKLMLIMKRRVMRQM